MQFLLNQWLLRGRWRAVSEKQARDQNMRPMGEKVKSGEIRQRVGKEEDNAGI